MTDQSALSPEQPPQPRWQPLSAIDRRVAGVLIEKAKTTPNAYPLSLNAIVTASNQKSNRSPVMDLDPDDVEESLERLRHLGAMGLIEGYGRVSKYRHYLYDWLGVDKVEIAVMAELLLRGTQTIGELRGRASRMEPIGDLGDLRPVLESLKSKGLVIPLTPEGRGHIVTHALYLPNELERVKAQYGGVGAAPAADRSHAPVQSPPPTAGPTPVISAPISAPTASPVQAPVASTTGMESEVAESLQSELEELRSQLAQLRSDFEDLSAVVQRTQDEFQSLRDALGG
ncbi:MAG: DUF480 domain-containing protein [Planctomycetota bacterium]